MTGKSCYHLRSISHRPSGHSFFLGDSAAEKVRCFVATGDGRVLQVGYKSRKVLAVHQLHNEVHGCGVQTLGDAGKLRHGGMEGEWHSAFVLIWFGELNYLGPGVM